MTKTQALNKFWSSFGVPAFDEASVEYATNKPNLPYITYQTITDSFGSDISLIATIWYYGNSWKDINAKTDEISDYIGRGGKVIPCDNGAIWIKRGESFAQSINDSNDNMVRGKLLNVAVSYLTAN